MQQVGFDERYRAIAAKDPRFDGHFFTAVRSTGIYCRPSCPARTPKAANVTFYPTSAAAHAAGYRACKRCLPEATPGSPDWNLRGDTAARAMRLIADGVVERDGVPGLAARLGYSTRQLDRILHAELGAGPLALARAHRAQTARTLLVGTDLSIADVAFAAGFGSIRQCNDTIAEVFAMTPSQLRATRRADAVPTGDVDLALPARRPLDTAGVFDWLAARAITGVEEADADGARYARSIRLPSGPARFEVRSDGDRGLRLTASTTALADLPVLIARVRRLFDLDADPEAVDAALTVEPALAASVAATPGIRLPGTVAPDELLIRAIVGQQVSVAAARTTLGRLTELAGEDSPHGRLFPTSAALAALDPEAIGGPRRHVIVDVVSRLADGRLALHVGADTAGLRADLEAVRGIGPWTSGYLAMRVLGDPDILLTGDLALRAGARRLGLPDQPAALAARLAPLAPWRSYVSMHLWRAAAGPPASAASTDPTDSGKASA